MSQAPLNVAVVGCGIFGELHVQTYAGFGPSRLVAVCDVNAKRARKLGRQFGCRWCTSVDEIADAGDIQAVSVATPDFAHRDVCVALAKAGKHLLIEKPLATSVADARAIAAAVDRAGVIAMMDFHNRYHPALRAFKEPLDAGQAGRLQMMFARLSDRIEVATDWFGWSGRSGPQWFLGSHLADVACWLFGADPLRVFAEGRKDVLAARGIDCYDSMHIHLSFPEGFATLETSWIVPNTWPMICDFYVSLQSTEARADIDMNHQGVTVAGARRFDRPFLYGRTPVGNDEFGFIPYSIREFVRVVQSGGPSPLPVALGVKNVQIISAAVQSAETGKVMTLGK